MIRRKQGLILAVLGVLCVAINAVDGDWWEAILWALIVGYALFLRDAENRNDDLAAEIQTLRGMSR